MLESTYAILLQKAHSAFLKACSFKPFTLPKVKKINKYNTQRIISHCRAQTPWISGGIFIKMICFSLQVKVLRLGLARAHAGSSSANSYLFLLDVSWQDGEACLLFCPLDSQLQARSLCSELRPPVTKHSTPKPRQKGRPHHRAPETASHTTPKHEYLQPPCMPRSFAPHGLPAVSRKTP